MANTEAVVQLIEGYSCKKVAEVGVLRGVLAKAVQERPYDEVHIIRLESVRAATLFQPESLDLVFIDADHTYPALSVDILAWLPTIKKGGILAGDDYHFRGGHSGVRKAVDELLEGVLLRPGGTWYIEK